MKLSGIFHKFQKKIWKLLGNFIRFEFQKKVSLNKPNLTTNQTQMLEYGIGGQEVKQDASEGIADIPMNRTLFVQKLTADAPPKPKVVYDLKTVEDVFDHYKPEVKCEFESENGTPVNETLRFSNLGNFGSKGITQQSKFLNDLSVQQEQFQKIKKALNTNKLMKNVLENNESRKAFMDALVALAQELE